MWFTILLAALSLCGTVATGSPNRATGWKGFLEANLPGPDSDRKICVVEADPAGGDDAPAIIDALSRCRQNGYVKLPSATYHINTVMNTTWLSDVKIDLHGRMVWSSNTTYWLNVSMPVGYQNQSTVWFLGGERVQFNGFGNGTLDGNGQAWYNLVKGQSNYPNRPMAITIYEMTNSIISGLRFLNSQMWTMNIMFSENILLEDIYVNSTSINGYPARNTDGADTMFSKDITFRRWTIDNGDDAISVKSNSTNVVVEDSVFYRGQGIAVGSIGQYPGEFAIIDGFYVRNVTLIRTNYAGYIKTWTGVQLGVPPNGGGGGLGYASNIIWEDLKVDAIRSYPFYITQCTSFSGFSGQQCETSLFKIKDILWTNITGTSVSSSRLGYLDCSDAAGGCSNITLTNVDVRNTVSGNSLTTWRCGDVNNSTGVCG